MDTLKQIAVVVAGVLIAAVIVRVGMPVIEWMVPEMARAGL